MMIATKTKLRSKMLDKMLMSKMKESCKLGWGR